MKNIKASLILAAHLLFAFTMAGCDPATGYEYYLNNQSDSILIVMFKAEEFSRTNSDSTRVVEPKTETLFYDVKAWGKNPHGEKNNFLKMFDTIAVTTQGRIPLGKDIYDRVSWEYDNDISHLGFIKIGTNIYRLKLTNDDFKKE